MKINYRKIKISSLMLILLSLIFIYASSTYLRSYYSFYIAVASYVGFYLISVCLGQKWRPGNTCIWVLLALLACPVYAVSSASEVLTTYLSGIIYLLFWHSAFVYLADNYDRKTIKRFTIINLCILIPSILSTIRVLEVYPLAARAINGAAEGVTAADIAVYTDMGCGGFGFIYGAVFMSLGLAAVFRAQNVTMKTRIFAILMFILVFNMILSAEFTTALLLSFTMLLFALIMNSKNLRMNVILVGLICLLVAIFSQQILEGIKSIAESFNISYLENKMDMLIKASSSESIDNLSRTQRYMESLNGFASNPLFGTGKSGGHSQILDTFSAVGVFALPYLMLLFSMFKNLKKYIDKKYSFILAVGIIILETLNPFVDSTIISMSFMLTPALLYAFVPSSNTSEEEKSE